MFRVNNQETRLTGREKRNHQETALIITESLSNLNISCYIDLKSPYLLAGSPQTAVLNSKVPEHL